MATSGAAVGTEITNQMTSSNYVKGTGSSSIGLPANVSMLFNKLMFDKAKHYDTQTGVWSEENPDINSEVGGILGAINTLKDKTPFATDAGALTTQAGYGKRISGDEKYLDTQNKISAIGITKLISDAIADSKTIIDDTLLKVDDDKGVDATEVKKLFTKLGLKTLETFEDNTSLKDILSGAYTQVASDISNVVGPNQSIVTSGSIATATLKTFLSNNVLSSFIDSIVAINPKDGVATFTTTALETWIETLPALIKSIADQMFTDVMEVTKETYISDAVTEYTASIAERFALASGKLNSTLAQQNAVNATSILFATRQVERDKNIDISKFETDLKLKAIELFLNAQLTILQVHNSNFVPFYQASLASDTQLASMVGNVIDAFVRIMLANADYVQAQIDTKLNATNSVYSSYSQAYGQYFNNYNNFQNQVMLDTIKYVFDNKDKYDNSLVKYYNDVLEKHYMQTYQLYSDFYGKSQQLEIADYNWNLDALTKGVGLVGTINGAVKNTMDAMPAWAMALQSIASGISAVGNVVSMIP